MELNQKKYDIEDIADAIEGGGGSGGGFVFPSLDNSQYLEGPWYYYSLGQWAVDNSDLYLFTDYVEPDKLLYINSSAGRIYPAYVYNFDLMTGTAQPTNSGNYYIGEAKQVTVALITIANMDVSILFGASESDFEWRNAIA